jgi:hypothetical protein
MKRLYFSLFLTAGVIALTAPLAAADDDDHRGYRRWHREQLEALEEWQERQEELAEKRREWEEERREAAREWQEEQREAAERYQRRQRELWEEEQERRRDAGYYESYRPVYPQQPSVYHPPQYFGGRIYRGPEGQVYYHQAPGDYYPDYDPAPPVYHHRGYNPRASAIGARIGSRIGGAIGGAEGAAIGGRLGAEIGGEID